MGNFLKKEAIRMFKLSFNRLLVKQRDKGEAIFQDIEGYNDIKKLMMRCIVSPEPTHVILDGPPASGKTMFLLSMQKGLDNAYFVDWY